MGDEQIPQHSNNALPLPRQHDPRLHHIQRRRDARGHSARYAPVQRALPRADLRPPARPVLFPPPPAAAPALEGLPQRELDDGEGHLAHDGDAPAAVQLAPDAGGADGAVLPEDGAQRRGARAAVVPRLRALLDDLGGHAHGARGDLAQARGRHVLEGLHPRAAPPAAPSHRSPYCHSHAVVVVVEPPPPARARQHVLDALVGAEEEGGAGRGAHDGGAHAAVHAAEAARGEEAGAGLQAGLERVEREEGEVDRRACYAAGQEGRCEGGVGWLRHGR